MKNRSVVYMIDMCLVRLLFFFTIELELYFLCTLGFSRAVSPSFVVVVRLPSNIKVSLIEKPRADESPARDFQSPRGNDTQTLRPGGLAAAHSARGVCVVI